MFSELATEHETFYKIYDIKNKKLYELNTSDGSFIEQEYIDPYKMINIIEKYSNLNYPNDSDELALLIEEENCLSDYPEITIIDYEPMFMGVSVYEIIDTFFDNHTSIFNNEYLIKYVEETIDSNFQNQNYDPDSYYEKVEEENILNSPEYIFYAEYVRIKGNIITSFEEYQYWFNLFVLLTGAKIGNYSPISSDDGFDHFYKIFSKTYKSKKLNMKMEFNTFFNSIDGVHAYT